MDKATAGAAALSIVGALLISFQELKIISAKEAHSILANAAATHRNAIPASPSGDEHRMIAELIEYFIDPELGSRNRRRGTRRSTKGTTKKRRGRGKRATSLS